MATAAGLDLELELAIAADHGAYAGHFPRRPILPGAVLLDEVLRAAARHGSLDPREWRLATAKFLAPVSPGQVLTLHVTATDAATLRFVIRAAGCTVASGMLSRGG